jgi:hypothetical protein
MRCDLPQYTGLAFFKPKMKALPLPPWLHTSTVHAQLAGNDWHALACCSHFDRYPQPHARCRRFQAF